MVATVLKIAMEPDSSGQVELALFAVAGQDFGKICGSGSEERNWQ
jgi:hypothetical protein